MERSSFHGLKKVFQELYNIRSIKSILNWDMEVMMPKNSIEMRAEQIAFLTELFVKKIKSKNMLRLFSEASRENLTHWEYANLRNMKRCYASYSVVPSKLVTYFSWKSDICNSIWREAYNNNDWQILLPHLEELVSLIRKIAKIKGDAFGKKPYDALLDEYDPEMTSEKLDDNFTILEKELPTIFNKAITKQPKKIDLPPLKIKTQKKIGMKIMKNMGFDFTRGRLDTSTHPFCSGGHSDIRITTRYDENNPLMALYGIMHETGHAIYEKQLPQEWKDQPVGEALGFAMHESQSLLAEMQIGLSTEFIEYLVEVIREECEPGDRHLWTVEAIISNIRYVQPSFIRVEADEVTYPFHVITRYRIEQALINHDIEVADIPMIWKEYTQKFLGIVPPSYKQGCLQDIHWPSGAFGYFPSYTNGAMIAAQIISNLKMEVHNWKTILKKGEIHHMMQWLEKKIHRFGSYFKDVDDILLQSTGSKLNPKFFLDHLRSRYC